MIIASWAFWKPPSNAHTNDQARWIANKHELLRLIDDLPHIEAEAVRLYRSGLTDPGDILARLKLSKRVKKRVEFQARSAAKRIRK
jgi:hypothetical protein